MFEPRPKWRQILRHRTIDANLGPASRGMEITASGHQQAEFTRQNGQGSNLLGRLQAIHYLNRMATRLNEGSDQLTTFTTGKS